MMPRCFCLLLLAAIAGCDNSLAVNLPSTVTRTETPHDRFDPQQTGTITGVVAWAGDRPKVEPIKLTRFESRGMQVEAVPNPNAPQIAANGVVQSGVVFLRGVDPALGNPAAAPPTRVELEETRLSVFQGGTRYRTAFVPVGSEVDIRSTFTTITGVRGRGADFFTTMLPDANAVTRRTFSRPGRVELTSASGQFWAVADLFVCEHAYYARTDAAGRFALPDVPAGEYELVCWHPNWHILGTERDPETAMVVRQKYGPAVEKIARVRVTVQGTVAINFTLASVDFTK
ncbi:carboxypeptidase-like regulatory domain-containing protein [Limnoglobus roseus]|uniref:Lipoprotein n=1 Tax=Limnoglobus roseus TaxID=2598579 RepID=A0A5C1AF57_9BACT|nr:carboxypeptidase-like regulatory domain-containing protein [Limnoglobus roseus]QEL17195.1 lipoprotein [Limnoglobus roseus]